jgi:hypothetical protein
LRRIDFGAGVTNGDSADGDSADGGFDEFRELSPNRRFDSAFLARNAATSACNCSITALTRHQGGKLVIRRTPIPGLHTLIPFWGDQA